VVPGFNDGHMHVVVAAEDLLHLDLSSDSVRSLAEVKSKVRAEAAAASPGSWIRGSRYDDGKMAEARILTRWDLDEVAPDHPVLVTHVAFHWAVANSRALALGGIDGQTAPPAGGAHGRDASGHLNGILYEQALFDFANPSLTSSGRTVVPSNTLDEKLDGLRRATRMFHAAGLTSVCDALVGPDDLALLREAERRGLLTLRVNVLVVADRYDELRGLVNDWPGGEFLRFCGVKTFVDGAIGGRTCLLEQPFEGTTDDYGIQTRSTAYLRDAVRLVNGDGVRLCVHANGDRAINLILDLMEEWRASAPATAPAPRNRIEHCTIVTEDILRRMKRLDAVAVPFGSYVHYHGGKLGDWYGRERLKRMFAHRWFLDAGVGVAGSSDFPCGPYQPLLALQSCVSRRGWDGPILGENQRVTATEALALYTTLAAAATGESDRKGALAPGMVADFTVLGGDPLSVDAEALGGIPVLATYVGGEQVYAADSAP